ncbi:MAG TPA: Gfo/Idh/MocA family oxidoreductase [Stellaceae bacterium]|jgi:predicted dehydrogenase|nr:Gfo/Idh/MocA family oxidoreductase [Stellaceae bacterium]
MSGDKRSLRFAAIGLDHPHIWMQVEFMREAGAELVAFHAADDKSAKPFAERYPQAKRVDDPRQIIEDDGIALVVSAAIPCERAGLGISVMRHGKDFMVDKPGMTSLAQLAAVREAQRETGRIYSICYSEHFATRSTVRAGELVAAGAIGRVVNVVGLGPHRLDNEARPAWFFRRDMTGGILTDIASHQCEQFLFLTGAEDAEIAAATVGNRAHPDTPELQDFGEMLLRTEGATGYIRVDWFTPAGLPTWGDGRLFILGTEGYIELRKYIDPAGAPGADHLLLVDPDGMHRVDCSGVALSYGRQLLADIRQRTETAMPQARCFKAMELALKAQALAEER